ncbi:MAG: calcium-binding protein [Bacteroidetes bacterium QH_2_64_26]|nr:MAG: calcium-binding protein [Bacteroidetes bacterium QH_2_64_26]
MNAHADDTDEAKERKDRIYSEILVDAYDFHEQALGWYYHLERKLSFPFEARCVRKRPVSPLRTGETVRATGLPGEESCMDEMFVTIDWDDRTLGVPLSQLEGIDIDAEAQQSIADWKYWNG